MKKYLLLFLALLNINAIIAQEDSNYESIDMIASMKPGDKAALLMVHFGTTYDETRSKTIDAINEKARIKFENMEVREAYTSRIIIRRLKAKGIEKLNPSEALSKLRADGFTHVVVQSSNIIEGVEMEALRRDVAANELYFKDIRVGHPLLYRVEDYEKVVDILTADKSTDKVILLVGHGTHTPSTSQYAMLEHMLKARGHDNYYVTTVEGYPTLEVTLSQIEKNGVRDIELRPFMFVAGDHAHNDISNDIKGELETRGYTVNVFLEGLGEIPAIQEIFMDQIDFTLKNKAVDIMTKKKQYQIKD